MNQRILPLVIVLSVAYGTDIAKNVHHFIALYSSWIFLCTVPWASPTSGNWLLAAYLPAQIKVSLPKLSFAKAQTSPRCLTHICLHKFLRFLTQSCLSHPRTSVTARLYKPVCLHHLRHHTLEEAQVLHTRPPSRTPVSTEPSQNVSKRDSSTRHTVRASCFSSPVPPRHGSYFPTTVFFLVIS